MEPMISTNFSKPWTKNKQYGTSMTLSLMSWQLSFIEKQNNMLGYVSCAKWQYYVYKYGKHKVDNKILRKLSSVFTTFSLSAEESPIGKTLQHTCTVYVHVHV